ncbi:MAG: hypothetical protein M4579_000131 [Chaenotheca gracillima]|nr:MAG: hypothetical protein M4579_000131 [Chaenotheca gracillima]
MQLPHVVGILALAGGAIAQGYGAPAKASSTAPAAASKTSAASVATSSNGVPLHSVQVSNANGAFVFSPADITAAKGDMVQFEFLSGNHSVVQSTYDQPCQPSAKGIFSGFMAISSTSAKTVPAFTITVNDTNPIWFYCAQVGHCQAGMVGVINAPSSNKTQTLANFKTLAKDAPPSVAGAVVEGGVNSNVNPSASSASSPTASSSTPSATPNVADGILKATTRAAAWALAGVLTFSVLLFF